MLLFDIGANVGSWALANLKHGSKIISIEASPSTFNKLRANTSHTSIEALHYAICDTSDSFVQFYHCHAADWASTLDKNWLTSSESRFGGYRNTIQEITVPAKKLDDLIKTYGIPDLVKIDVEGAENSVLQSLTQKVPMLCFEWASEWHKKNVECLHLLENLGFTRFEIQIQDNYTFRPSKLDQTKEDVIEYLTKTKPKQDWGMIWAV